MITPAPPSSARSLQPNAQGRGPVTHKHPDAIQDFHATCPERLERVMPPDHARPVRVFRQDESRVGLLTVRRRRLTAAGVPPVGAVPHVFEGFDVDGAVEPTTGARVCLERPSLKADTCPIFIDAFAHACPDRLNSLRLENRGAHPAQCLRWPEQVRPLWLPPDGPELNPIERVWRDLKDDLAWLQCPDLDAQQVSVGDLWQTSEAPALQALTSDADLVDAINARLL